MSQQQLSKFERGGNRITAGQLYRIARHLGLPIGEFFRDIDAEQPSQASQVLAAIYDSLPESKRAALMVVARALQE